MNIDVGGDGCRQDFDPPQGDSPPYSPPPFTPSTLQGIQRQLGGEVLRKLSEAAEAESWEDAEVLCTSVFTDVAGVMGRRARAALKEAGASGTDESPEGSDWGGDGDEDSDAGRLEGGSGLRFFEVLAPYYNRDHDAAHRLLPHLRALWGRPYVSATFALVLHEWLFNAAAESGEELKYLNVFLQGTRQLMDADLKSDTTSFRPIYLYLLNRVALRERRYRTLPKDAARGLVALLARFAPLYLPPGSLPGLLGRLPGAGGQDAYDLAVGAIVDQLGQIKVEPVIIKYLEALEAAGGPEHLGSLRNTTLLRLQAGLYSLTSPGGPRYAPRNVRHAAHRTLNVLFPMGRRARYVISSLFRLLHPSHVASSLCHYLRAKWEGLLPAPLRVVAASLGTGWEIAAARVGAAWSRARNGGGVESEQWDAH